MTYLKPDDLVVFTDDWFSPPRRPIPPLEEQTAVVIVSPLGSLYTVVHDRSAQRFTLFLLEPSQAREADGDEPVHPEWVCQGSRSEVLGQLASIFELQYEVLCEEVGQL